MTYLTLNFFHIDIEADVIPKNSKDNQLSDYFKNNNQPTLVYTT